MAYLRKMTRTLVILTNLKKLNQTNHLTKPLKSTIRSTIHLATMKTLSIKLFHKRRKKTKTSTSLKKKMKSESSVQNKSRMLNGQHLTKNPMSQKSLKKTMPRKILVSSINYKKLARINLRKVLQILAKILETLMDLR